MTEHEPLWDGTERRRHQLPPAVIIRPGIQIPLAMFIVAMSTVILLQMGALWGHAVIDRHASREAERAERFRQQLTCFVVKATQTPPGTQAGPELLTDCGFLDTGGKR